MTVLVIFRIGGSLVAALLLATQAHAATFSYFGETGPDFWHGLSPDWTACGTGTMQSPVDLGTQSALTDLNLDYDPDTGGEIFDNGHTVEVELTASANTLRLDGRDYTLRQFHFHVPSEHRVGGRGYDMELHLVHQAADGGIAVIAVFLQRGKSSGALGQIFDRLPGAGGEPNVKTELDFRFDPGDFLPPSRPHFRYRGSLTTPPCTEGVEWVVLRDPVTVRDEDMARFAALISFNARDTQRAVPAQP